MNKSDENISFTSPKDLLEIFTNKYSMYKDSWRIVMNL